MQEFEKDQNEKKVLTSAYRSNQIISTDRGAKDATARLRQRNIFRLNQKVMITGFYYLKW